MKTATVFLVALTAFTGLLRQSSAAPWFGSGLSGLLQNAGTTLSTTIQDMGDTLSDVLKPLAGEGDTTTSKTEDIESILSKLEQKTTESETKTNTNNKFKNSITELIDRCNASLHEILKTLENALATPTVCRKKQGLNKAKRWMEDFEAMVKEMHNDLTVAAASDDKNKLEDLNTRMTKAISETEADLPDLLANLDSIVQDIVKKYMKIILNVAQTIVSTIDNHVSG